MQPNASRHLNKFKSAGVITYNKKSQWTYYQINRRFKEENSLLYQFINKEVKKNHEWLKDVERLYKYKDSGYTCENLRQDKDEVAKCFKK